MVLKFLLTFAAGVYSGVYLAQNYNIPNVDEPRELWRKVSQFIEEYNQKYKKDSQDGKRE